MERVLQGGRLGDTGHPDKRPSKPVRPPLQASLACALKRAIRVLRISDLRDMKKGRRFFFAHRPRELIAPPEPIVNAKCYHIRTIYGAVKIDIPGGSVYKGAPAASRAL